MRQLEGSYAFGKLDNFRSLHPIQPKPLIGGHGGGYWSRAYNTRASGSWDRRSCLLVNPPKYRFPTVFRNRGRCPGTLTGGTYFVTVAKLPLQLWPS